VPLKLTAEAAFAAKRKTRSGREKEKRQGRSKSKAATAEIVESGVEEGEEQDYKDSDYSHQRIVCTYTAYKAPPTKKQSL